MKYLKYDQYMQNSSEYPPLFSYLKHLQAINPSFVFINKLLSNKRISLSKIEMNV